jgi:hypothetical protein
MPLELCSNGKLALTASGKIKTCGCDPEPEPSCCMYPADGLGVTYEAEDLPDQIAIQPGGIHDYNGIYTKSGSEYNYTGVWEYALRVFDTGEGKVWRLTTFDGFTLDDWESDVCLITGDGNLTPGDDVVEDQFADCYEVDFSAYVGSAGAAIIVNRVSQCVWRTAITGSICGTTADSAGLEEFIVTLTYNEGIDKWSVSITIATTEEFEFDSEFGPPSIYWRCIASGASDGDYGIKAPHQDTPVGSYYIDPEAEEGLVATVTQC